MSGLLHEEMIAGWWSCCWGCCSWFISALAAVAATAPDVIRNRFIEANPSLGYYVLSFFKHGKWVEVIVDDRLLVMGGKWRGYKTTSLLLGMTLNTDDPTEVGRAIWLPIIEKAYAKLHGGYSNIEGGSFSYGVRDLSGAAPELFSKQDGSFIKALESGKLLGRIKAAAAHGVKLMVGLSVHRAGSSAESDIGNGLLSDHEYSLIRLVDTGGQLPLLCLLRNPWGKKEWSGAWSDRDSRRWTSEAKRVTGYSPDGDDGEFMMSYDDMVREFDTVEMSLLFPDSFFRSKVDGDWKDSHAGGCGNVGGQAAFLSNPQYLLTIPEPPKVGMGCYGTIVLTQDDVRWTQQGRGRKMFSMGFSIFNTTNGEKLRSLHAPGVETGLTSGSHINRRAVSCELSSIEPGEYIIVPSTFHPAEECMFYLTTWMSYPVNLELI